MQLDGIQQLIKKGRLDEALVSLSQLELPQELQGKILKSRIFEKKGKFKDALRVANAAFEQAKAEGRTVEELGARIAQAYANVRLTYYDTTIRILEEAREIVSNHQAGDYVLMKTYEATIENIEGLCYHYQGKLNQALKKYTRSLEIRSKLANKEEFASSLSNIGTVYQNKGELQKAIDYHMEALEIFAEMGNDILIAYALHDIAGIYWERGNLSLAKEYFEKALNIRLEQNNPQTICITLYELILLNLEFDYPDQANYYLDMLSQIAESNDDISIQTRYRLAKAALLKTSNRLIKKAEAQKIYQSVVEAPVVDYSLTKNAMLNLCDMLIMDLKINKNDEILQEVEYITNELFNITKSQNSLILLVETYLLQAKLALIKLDLETAQNLLTQAEVTARENELYKAAMKVSSVYDSVLNKLNKFETLQKRNASVSERIEAVDLQQTINEMIGRRSTDIGKNKSEDPLFLLILNDNSVTLYSEKFEESIPINEQLIGGFLMATDFSMKEALNNRGSIERIKYGDYNLVFLKYDHLTFCYAFEGQSFFAIQRLNNFIDRIKLGRSWQYLSSRYPKPKKIKEDLAPKVNDFFLKSDFKFTID